MFGLKIGLIGVGTIGGFLVKRIQEDSSLELCFVLDIDPEKVKDFSEDIVINSISEMGAKKPDLVIEAASQQAIGQYAEHVLSTTNFLVLSVGAFADKGLEEKVKGLCKSNGTKLFAPSGAIAAIDLLKAMQSELEEVEIVSRKNPKGWGREDSEKTIIFEGTAREACKAYPKNINISATVSLNGIGFDKTTVKLVSDPDCGGNRHTLNVKHAFGNFVLDVKAQPTKNPKTSSTAAYSAFDLVKKIQNGINIF